MIPLHCMVHQHTLRQFVQSYGYIMSYSMGYEKFAVPLAEGVFSFGVKCRGRSGTAYKFRYRNLIVQLQWCNSRKQSERVLAAIRRFYAARWPQVSI